MTRFYNIQGYEEWGTDVENHEGDSGSGSSSARASPSSTLPVPLGVTVRANPEVAHRALAAQLGLVYDAIERFMERAQELGHTQAIKERKRSLAEQTYQDERRQVPKLHDEEGTDITSPSEPLPSQ